jgi:hypothetical protein
MNYVRKSAIRLPVGMITIILAARRASLGCKRIIHVILLAILLSSTMIIGIVVVLKAVL